MSFCQICQRKGSLQMVQKAPAHILNISDLFWPDCTGSLCSSKLISRCFLLTYKLVNGHATNVCSLVRFSFSGAGTLKVLMVKKNLLLSKFSHPDVAPMLLKSLLKDISVLCSYVLYIKQCRENRTKYKVSCARYILFCFLCIVFYHCKVLTWKVLNK